MIKVACPRCEARFRIDDSAAGQWARCTKCNCRIDVPTASHNSGRQQEPILSVVPVKTGQARTDAIILRVSAVKLDWPYRCACCMRQAQVYVETAAVRQSDTRVDKTDVRSWNVPYCGECADHMRMADAAAEAHADGVQMATLGLIGVFALAVPVTIALVWNFGCLAIVGLGAPVLWWVASNSYIDSLRNRALARARECQQEDCESLHSAVRYKGWHGSVHTFSFQNEDYAEAFFQANEKKIVA